MAGREGIDYHATPGGVPVAYRLTTLAPGLATFERTDSEAFPKRATYTRRGDRLTLTLTGQEAGRPKTHQIVWWLARWERQERAA